MKAFVRNRSSFWRDLGIIIAALAVAFAFLAVVPTVGLMVPLAFIAYKMGRAIYAGYVVAKAQGTTELGAISVGGIAGLLVVLTVTVLLIAELYPLFNTTIDESTGEGGALEDAPGANMLVILGGILLLIIGGGLIIGTLKKVGLSG